MHVCKNAYKKLKLATVALQCALRQHIAKKTLAQLNHEQNNMAKLKENNEKLKNEMAILEALLQVQVASKMDKQKEIDHLQSRLKQFDIKSAREKEKTKKLENDLRNEMKEKNEELLTLRGKLQQSMALCVKKDKTQEIDSKLIMEMSAKLVNLSMENANLIRNNDRLEQRLVEMECKLKESVS